MPEENGKELSMSPPQMAIDSNQDVHLPTVDTAEGRRIYIGNLTYATTEEELATFFKGYIV